MDFPDPAELWGYYRRLHDAGFGHETARAIIAAVVTGLAEPEPDVKEIDRGPSWVDAAANVVSQCGKACSEMHTYDADCGLGIPEKDANDSPALIDHPFTTYIGQGDGLALCRWTGCSRRPQAHDPNAGRLTIHRGVTSPSNDTRLANVQVMQSETLAGMGGAGSPTSCSFEAEGLSPGNSTSVKCEPSYGAQTDTYLFVDGGHGFLSRDETILLRDTLTAILGDDS